MTSSVSLIQATVYPTNSSTEPTTTTQSALERTDTGLSQVEKSLSDLARSSIKAPKRERALFDQIEKLLSSLARLIEAFTKLRSEYRASTQSSLDGTPPSENSPLPTDTEGPAATTSDPTATPPDTVEEPNQTSLDEVAETEPELPSSTETETTGQTPSPIGSLLSKSGQFLWKPDSDKDGKLAVLLPSTLTGRIKSVSVLSPDGKKVLQKGRFSGIGNGSREHYRFTKAGGAFPDRSIVLIKLEDGSLRHVKINDTSKRTTR
jgi:hypothetical protein